MVRLRLERQRRASSLPPSRIQVAQSLRGDTGFRFRFRWPARSGCADGEGTGGAEVGKAPAHVRPGRRVPPRRLVAAGCITSWALLRKCARALPGQAEVLLEFFVGFHRTDQSYVDSLPAVAAHYLVSPFRFWSAPRVARPPAALRPPQPPLCPPPLCPPPPPTHPQQGVRRSIRREALKSAVATLSRNCQGLEKGI
jgi:hypothetical protein